MPCCPYKMQIKGLLLCVNLGQLSLTPADTQCLQKAIVSMTVCKTNKQTNVSHKVHQIYAHSQFKNVCYFFLLCGAQIQSQFYSVRNRLLTHTFQFNHSGRKVSNNCNSNLTIRFSLRLCFQPFQRCTTRDELIPLTKAWLDLVSCALAVHHGCCFKVHSVAFFSQLTHMLF